MNIPEAVQLYAAMTLLDPFAKKRTDEEMDAIAAQIASALPNTPLSWAMDYVNTGMRAGKLPSLPEIAVAWGPEARRRVEAVPVPTAPAEIEDDLEKWRAWEMARRASLVAGATPQQAQSYADRRLGVGQQRRVIESGRPAPQSAKENVKAQLRNWAERQRLEEERLNHQDGGDL